MLHSGRSVCAADRVQGRLRMYGSPIGSDVCDLGSFEEIDAQYALGLIESLR